MASSSAAVAPVRCLDAQRHESRAMHFSWMTQVTVVGQQGAAVPADAPADNDVQVVRVVKPDDGAAHVDLTSDDPHAASASMSTAPAASTVGSASPTPAGTSQSALTGPAPGVADAPPRFYYMDPERPVPSEILQIAPWIKLGETASPDEILDMLRLADYTPPPSTGWAGEVRIQYPTEITDPIARRMVLDAFELRGPQTDPALGKKRCSLFHALAAIGSSERRRALRWANLKDRSKVPADGIELPPREDICALMETRREPFPRAVVDALFPDLPTDYNQELVPVDGRLSEKEFSDVAMAHAANMASLLEWFGAPALACVMYRRGPRKSKEDTQAQTNRVKRECRLVARVLYGYADVLMGREGWTVRETPAYDGTPSGPSGERRNAISAHRWLSRTEMSAHITSRVRRAPRPDTLPSWHHQEGGASEEKRRSRGFFPSGNTPSIFGDDPKAWTALGGLAARDAYAEDLKNAVRGRYTSLWEAVNVAAPGAVGDAAQSLRAEIAQQETSLIPDLAVRYRDAAVARLRAARPGLTDEQAEREAPGAELWKVLLVEHSQRIKEWVESARAAPTHALLDEGEEQGEQQGMPLEHVSPLTGWSEPGSCFAPGVMLGYSDEAVAVNKLPGFLGRFAVPGGTPSPEIAARCALTPHVPVAPYSSRVFQQVHEMRLHGSTGGTAPTQNRGAFLMPPGDSDTESLESDESTREVATAMCIDPHTARAPSFPRLQAAAAPGGREPHAADHQMYLENAVNAKEDVSKLSRFERVMRVALNMLTEALLDKGGPLSNLRLCTMLFVEHVCQNEYTQPEQEGARDAVPDEFAAWVNYQKAHPTHDPCTHPESLEVWLHLQALKIGNWLGRIVAIDVNEYGDVMENFHGAALSNLDGIPTEANGLGGCAAFGFVDGNLLARIGAEEYRDYAENDPTVGTGRGMLSPFVTMAMHELVEMAYAMHPWCRNPSDRARPTDASGTSWVDALPAFSAAGVTGAEKVTVTDPPDAPTPDEKRQATHDLEAIAAPHALRYWEWRLGPEGSDARARRRYAGLTEELPPVGNIIYHAFGAPGDTTSATTTGEFTQFIFLGPEDRGATWDRGDSLEVLVRDAWAPTPVPGAEASQNNRGVYEGTSLYHPEMGDVLLVPPNHKVVISYGEQPHKDLLAARKEATSRERLMPVRTIAATTTGDFGVTKSEQADTLSADVAAAEVHAPGETGMQPVRNWWSPYSRAVCPESDERNAVGVDMATGCTPAMESQEVLEQIEDAERAQGRVGGHVPWRKKWWGQSIERFYDHPVGFARITWGNEEHSELTGMSRTSVVHSQSAPDMVYAPRADHGTRWGAGGRCTEGLIQTRRAEARAAAYMPPFDSSVGDPPYVRARPSA